MKTMKYIWMLILSVLVFPGCKDMMEDTGGFSGGYRLEMKFANPEFNNSVVETRNGQSILSPEEGETKIDDNGVILLFFNKEKADKGTYVGYKKVKTDDFSQDVNGGILLTTDLSALDGSNEMDFSNTDYEVMAMTNYIGKVAETDDEVVKKVTGKTLYDAKYLFIEERDGDIVSPFLMSDIATYEHKKKALTIALKRAVSKIIIKKSAEGDEFKLMNVRIYNGRDSIYAFDCNGEFPAGVNSNGVKKESKEEIEAQKFVLYDYETFSDNVYDDIRSAMCVIIGAELKSLPGNIYYYRVNVNVRNGRQRIKRNSVYQINVNKINGIGAPSPEESVDSDVSLIEISEPAWNENYDGVYTYAPDGKGFAFLQTTFDHRAAEVSDKAPHGDTFDFYWRDLNGKTLKDTDIPLSSAISVEAKVNGELKPEILTAEVTDGSRGTPGSERAEKLKITAKDYFTKGTITVTYKVNVGNQPSSVSKTLYTSLQPYNEGPILFKDENLASEFIVDKENFGGNKSFFDYVSTLKTCPAGMRPMSLLESMFILSGSKPSKDGKGLYYVDGSSNTQIHLPYTGYMNSDSQAEKGNSAYFWTSSVGFTASAGGRNTENSALTYFYGTKGNFFPTVVNYSESTDAGKKFPIRCVRPAMDPALPQNGNHSTLGGHSKPEDFEGYIYKTYKELTPLQKTFIKALLKTIAGVDVELPDTELPVAIPELYVKNPLTMEGIVTSVPVRDKFSMIVVGANGIFSLPGGYRYAKEDEIKKILFQGTTFNKPILPGNGYGDVIVISPTSDDGPYNVFKAAEWSDTAPQLWKKGEMQMEDIKKQRHIYFIVESNELPEMQPLKR